MPVVTVQSLRPTDPSAIERLLVELPLKFAAAVGGAPTDLWVYWSPVEAADSGGHRGWEGHCPIVTIRARSWRSDEDIRKGLAAVGEAVSSALSVPLEDVWVHWSELDAGRVFAGGRIR